MKTTQLSFELLEVLGINTFTKRHLSIVETFIENDLKVKDGVSNQDVCEAFLTELGSWDSNDLQKTQAFVEVNFC